MEQDSITQTQFSLAVKVKDLLPIAWASPSTGHLLTYV